MVTMPEEQGGRDDAAVRWDIILNDPPYKQQTQKSDPDLDEPLASGVDLKGRIERLKEVVDIESVDRVDELLQRPAGNDQDLHRYRTLLSKRLAQSRLGRDGSNIGSSQEAHRPVIGNLAYPRGSGLMDSDRILQPGLIIASFPNLQPHIAIEYPDGSIALMDKATYRNAGEVIWTDLGTGILKALDTGEHFPDEVEIRGVTTMGFCLLRPPGQRNYSWFAPRTPEELGGRNRPTYISDGRSVHGYVLESFSIDRSILKAYHDISGLVVELQDPERSPRRHRDHLGPGH